MVTSTFYVLAIFHIDTIGSSTIYGYAWAVIWSYVWPLSTGLDVNAFFFTVSFCKLIIAAQNHFNAAYVRYQSQFQYV